MAPRKRPVVWLWVCCNCGGSGWSIRIENCPGCNAPRCQYCEVHKNAVPKRATLAPYTSSAETPPPAISYPRAKRRHLAILIQGVLVETCCADSGSEVNCLTRDFARSIGVVVTNKVTYLGLPIKKLLLKATGIVSIICQFPSTPTMAQSVKFFVFDKLQCDVLLGRPFLRATQTLDLHQHRLRQIEGVSDTTLAVRSVGHAEERVQCWLDGKPVRTLPDTGADLNLISPAFAREIGYDNKKGKSIDRGPQHQIDLEIADGSTVTTEGAIQVSISFASPKESNSTVYELIESSEKRTSTSKRTEIQGNYQIRETFYVLAELNYEVILGETLLATVDAYTQHTTKFSLLSGGIHSCVAIFRRKKAGEGKTDPTLPLTAEQKFVDEFSLEDDRYRKEKENIEERQKRGAISDEQAKVKNFQADQDHLQWLKNSRDLLQRYYPGYYERNVLQEIV
ncbi:hypothetical protein N431DRAFT_402782 [Stipitochalara longipes BDJ]|nr:hypothetical protein N431DRAFT_402782 [Stipitochalara longipes BDJ]